MSLREIMFFDKSKTMKTSHPAVVLFEKTLAEAKDGDAVAMVNIGLMYANGEGVVKDDKEAVKWYRKAAELGNAGAMNNLGFKYANGEGVIEDAVEAYGWFNVAAANGYKRTAELREMIKNDMTSEQIAEGQKRSREIMEFLTKK